MDSLIKYNLQHSLFETNLKMSKQTYKNHLLLNRSFRPPNQKQGDKSITHSQTQKWNYTNPIRTEILCLVSCFK